MWRWGGWPNSHGAAILRRGDWTCRRRRTLEAFADGVRPKPQTTFGNVKADVLAHYERGDFVRTILDSPWPD
ncbi:hypothetical protein GCM10010319_27300 [Streptomyces blastmyceticus]|uniref:Uncharacterized protein n=1 Tax=Streptomyces blastmyceticus TaxID=68180 RepID=A0ABP3GQH0_9ACTN